MKHKRQQEHAEQERKDNMMKFCEMLKAKGIVNKVQDAVNHAFIPSKIPDEIRKDMLMDATKAIILFEVSHDEELTDAFEEMATDMFLNAIIKELGINYETKNKESEEDVLNIILKDIIKTILN